jgi:hypothetical protein
VDTGYFLFIPTEAQMGTNEFSFTATNKDGTSDPVLMSVKVYSAAAFNEYAQWIEDRQQDPSDPAFALDEDADDDGMTNPLVGTTNLGWGVPGMVVTSDAPATWYGVIRALLQEP